VPFKGGIVSLLNQGGFMVAMSRFSPEIMLYENMRVTTFLAGCRRQRQIPPKFSVGAPRTATVGVEIPLRSDAAWSADNREAGYVG